MGKLYIFGIGGTGSRVLRSLTMLLASGVDIAADEIVPVIIDPDHSAGDLTYTVELMRKYEAIRQNLHFDNATKNKFFKTHINMDIVPSVTIPLANTQNVDFKTYIGYQTMPFNGSNQAFASMLFSQKNLNSNMEVGFKGNPNIGSVVLNQFGNSQEFQNIVSSFNQGDRIFVISSIFGGTGASGFPLLVKNIRNANGNWKNAGVIKDAAIGAVTVLPYFSLKNNPQSEIDPSTFISKTKAALTYYEKSLHEPNVLYYIADDISNNYDNIEGGTGQSNDAHFVELAAALSIIDFAKIDGNMIFNANGSFAAHIYKEFAVDGVPQQNGAIIFSDLSQETKRQIMKPLTQFVFFCKYMKEQLPSSMQQPWAKNIGVNDNFVHSNFYQLLDAFRKSLFTDADEKKSVAKAGWLVELGRNTRAFKPYNLQENKSKLYEMVNGIEPIRFLTLSIRLLTLSKNYSLYDQWLNDEERRNNNGLPTEQRFFELFYEVTKKITEQKLRMN